MTAEIEIPDRVQDALAIVLEEQFALGMLNQKRGGVTPTQCQVAARALRHLCDEIKRALAAASAHKKEHP